MPRTIQPELLDTLSPHDPDAIHSRRDLRVINRFMGNHRWVEQALQSRVQATDRVLEVGAGTGELCQRLSNTGISVDGLDLLPPPEDWPESSTWYSADLRSFDGYGRYDVLIGNLIFHHLDDAELAGLGAVLRRNARLIIACEPTRRRSLQWLMRAMGPVFGASHVTLHDAHVSIAGGFANAELSRTLGLDHPAWDVQCSVGWLGGYRMIATRQG
jgi:2-polyprenyl-3-methyl-5-hydroxy-6-metoxy-1,4-benzoquinol methylase